MRPLVRASETSRAERAARGAIALWALLWIAHDALPYVGGRDDSCQTMFSSLEWGVGASGRAWNDHYLVPQRMVFDRWVLLEVDEVVIEGAPVDARDRALAAWLMRPTRLRSLDAVRVVVAQLCERHAVSLRHRQHGVVPTGAWGEPPGHAPRVTSPDACADPLLAPDWWIPVRLYETDFEVTPSATAPSEAP